MKKSTCIHPKIKIYQLVVSRRDWCNLYEEIRTQREIERKQAMVLKAEEKAG
jgi:hypothetical protein